MSKKPVHTPDAPAAIGPFSQAIVAGTFVFCSGQIGANPATGQLVEGGVTAQAHHVLQNLRIVLEAAGSGLDLVVKTSVFLQHFSDFAAMNEVYATYFTGAMPARTTVEVSALPRGALVEIECVALLPNS